MADNYQDLAIRRQVLLERVKSGQEKHFAKAIREIERLIRHTLAMLDGDLSDLSATQFEKLLAGLRRDHTAILGAAAEAFAVDLSVVASVAMAQEVLDLKKTIELGGTVLEEFTKPQLYRNVLKRPLSTNGELLEPWIKDFTAKEVKAIAGEIRTGWAQGKTNQEITKAVIGTKANKYRDGAMEKVRRHARAVTRTSVQHVASSARMEIWAKNPDIFRGYKWLSTLDRKTSAQCKSLDGLEFDIGKGPVPPIHPNCRSTTTPLTDPKFDFLDEGKTRSAEFGPVPAKQDYYQWLKRQDRGVVEEALGKKRAALFLDGGLSAERFRELQFDRNFEPLTLAELREVVPGAFKAAGL